MRVSNEQAAFYFELGLAITQWAQVEWNLHLVTSHCFNNRKGTHGPEFYEAFFSIENFRTKLQFADTIVSRALKGDPLAADWKAIAARLANGAKMRNKLAHYPALGFQDNPPGRNIALVPRALESRSPGTQKRAQKYPTGAIFLRDINRARFDFFALSVTLQNFEARSRGQVHMPFSASLEQPRNPQTVAQLTAQIRAMSALRLPPSRR